MGTARALAADDQQERRMTIASGQDWLARQSQEPSARMSGADEEARPPKETSCA